MRVNNRILLIAFFLLFILATSACHDDGLRGGSRGDEGSVREAQLPSFPSFLAFLWSLLGRVAAALIPTTTPPTTTKTFVPTTATTTSAATTTLAATTSSAFFSTEMTTPVTSGSAGTSTTSPSTAQTAPSMTASSIPTTSDSTETGNFPGTSTEPTTSTASTSTSTSSTSTSTMSVRTSTSPPAPKTVFVTMNRFFADLGGLEGGDNRCNLAAQAVNLTGRFSAWLSNSTDSPNSRFTRSLGSYLLVDGTKFADSYAALVSGSPLVPLNLQENNVTAAGSSEILVWTGTDPEGNSLTFNCDNWKSSSRAAFGMGGSAFSTSSLWSVAEFVECDNLRRLYCFEQ